MKASILDDYHDTLRTLGCLAKLAGHEVELQFSDVFDQIAANAAGTPINVVNPEAPEPGAT